MHLTVVTIYFRLCSTSQLQIFVVCLTAIAVHATKDDFCLPICLFLITDKVTIIVGYCIKQMQQGNPEATDVNVSHLCVLPVEIEAAARLIWWYLLCAGNLFQPFIFLLFNVGDAVGRTLPSFHSETYNPVVLFSYSGMRVLLVVGILLCNIVSNSAWMLPHLLWYAICSFFPQSSCFCHHLSPVVIIHEIAILILLNWSYQA